MTDSGETSTVLDENSLLERLRKCRSEQDIHLVDETELSIELTAILTHAVHDQRPLHSLLDIVHALDASGTSSNLDALHVVPLLLDIGDPSAGEILSLLAEHGNAKETVISAQESLEKLRHDLLTQDELEEGKGFLCLERLLRLYIGAIPRLKLRKRSASETLKPLFADIWPVIELAGPSVRDSDGKTIIRRVCSLLSCATLWASQQDDEADLCAVKTLCRNILSSTLTELSPFLQTNLAQQKFEACNPRLFHGKSAGEATCNEVLLQECAETALSLSYSIDSLLRERTTSSLILLSLFLSRSSSSVPSPSSILTAVFPVLIASLQSNTCIDPSLNILLYVLYPSSRNVVTSLDPDILAPLSTVLASLACTSPDPAVRLIAFRALGALLARAPPLERMSLLCELLTESPFPSLRVAAVGLLKGAVLEALAAGGDAGQNPFASPAMLRTFGYIVLRPDPPDLFARPANRETLEEFLETQEPKRLVECLAFYYVLLMRDVNNLTGLREPNQVNFVEKEFLSPLRGTLRAWVGLEDLETDEHAGMALAALETSLERIEEAYEKLNLRPE